MKPNPTPKNVTDNSGYQIRFILCCVVLLAILGVGAYAISVITRRPDTTSTSQPPEEKTATPKGNPTVLVDPDTGEGTIVFSPKAPPLPKPIDPQGTPTQLREYKPEGSKYKCKWTSQISGEGTKEAWKVGKGTASYVGAMELEWTETILENNGEILKVERHFTESRQSLLITGKDAGLTKAASAGGVGLGNLISTLGTHLPNPKAAGSLIVAGKAIALISELTETDTLNKTIKSTPFASIWQNWLDKQANETEEARKVQLLQKIVGNIKNERVILTWKKNRLHDVKYTSGAELSEQDRTLASKVGVYADLNLFPPEEKNVRDQWVISSHSIADIFNADAELRGQTKGQVLVLRQPDKINGKIALLTAAGRGTYDAKGTSLRFIINKLDAEFHYKDGKRFLSRATAKATLAYGQTDDPDSLLKGVHFSTEPIVNTEYSCEPQ